MTNEEKILELLEKQGKVLEQQGKLLEKHGTALEQQGKLLEKHGKLLTDLRSDMSEMRTTLTKVAVTQENIVLPRLQLLAEGHDTIQEQIKRLSVIDSLQDDVATLKSAVRFLSQKVEQLEKAM